MKRSPIKRKPRRPKPGELIAEHRARYALIKEE